MTSLPPTTHVTASTPLAGMRGSWSASTSFAMAPLTARFTTRTGRPVSAATRSATWATYVRSTLSAPIPTAAESPSTTHVSASGSARAARACQWAR